MQGDFIRVKAKEECISFYLYWRIKQGDDDVNDDILMDFIKKFFVKQIQLSRIHFVSYEVYEVYAMPRIKTY